MLLTTGAAQKFDDWADFRGPNGQGHARDAKPPLKWSAEENIVWRVEVPGEGWSSPILHRDRLFVTTALIEDGVPTSLRLLAFSAETGERIWDRELFNPSDVPGIHRKNSQASPTPIAEDGRIYAHFGHLGTACVDFDGEIIWKQDGLSYKPVHGNGGTPAIVDDLLIFSCDGGQDPFVVALEKATGEVRWKVPRVTEANKKFSFSTPLLIDVDGRRELVSPGSGAVMGYDPKSGDELWRVGYGEGYSVVPRPVYEHGLLFIGTGYDRPNVLAIRPGGKGDVTSTHVAWESRRGAPNTPSMLVVGDELYFSSDGGIASCVNARTGELHWQERLGGDVSASPIHADGRIYFCLENGKTVVVTADKEFQILAKNDLEERTLASPVAVGSTLFLRTQNHLHRIGE